MPVTGNIERCVSFSDLWRLFRSAFRTMGSQRSESTNIRRRKTGKRVLGPFFLFFFFFYHRCSPGKMINNRTGNSRFVVYRRPSISSRWTSRKKSQIVALIGEWISRRATLIRFVGRATWKQRLPSTVYFKKSAVSVVPIVIDIVFYLRPRSAALHFEWIVVAVPEIDRWSVSNGKTNGEMIVRWLKISGMLHLM